MIVYLLIYKMYTFPFCRNRFLFVEIEAVEACRWLKEAGFPQYAQMYDGMYIHWHC